MSEQIDWSKAPADATHYQAATHGVFECWLKPGHAVRVSRRDTDWREDDYADDLIATSAIKRPWSGEGLPPVGVVCRKCYNSPGEYYSVKVLAHDSHDGEVVIYRWIDGPLEGDLGQSTMHLNMASGSNAHWSFRPIRTPEQIAHDKRESAINEMSQDSNFIGFPSRSLLGSLYDAGYRKQ